MRIWARSRQWLLQRILPTRMSRGMSNFKIVDRALRVSGVSAITAEQYAEKDGVAVRLASVLHPLREI